MWRTVLYIIPGVGYSYGSTWIFGIGDSIRYRRSSIFHLREYSTTKYQGIIILVIRAIMVLNTVHEVKTIGTL